MPKAIPAPVKTWPVTRVPAVTVPVRMVPGTDPSTIVAPCVAAVAVTGARDRNCGTPTTNVPVIVPLVLPSEVIDVPVLRPAAKSSMPTVNVVPIPDIVALKIPPETVPVNSCDGEDWTAVMVEGDEALPTVWSRLTIYEPAVVVVPVIEVPDKISDPKSATVGVPVEDQRDG